MHPFDNFKNQFLTKLNVLIEPQITLNRLFESDFNTIYRQKDQIT